VLEKIYKKGRKGEKLKTEEQRKDETCSTYRIINCSDVFKFSLQENNWIIL
jgi:hypothetical protein